MPIDDASVVLTREELYQKVWATPMVRLAKEYGVSNTTVSNLCRRYQIPTPSGGYWIKKEFGKAPPQPPLPAITDSKPAIIQIGRNLTPLQENDLVPPEFLALMVAEKDPANHIRPVARLTSPHPWVAMTKQVLSQQTPERYGLLHLPFQGAESCLDVAVSPKELPRAMRIMETLMKAFKKREFTVTILPKDQDRLTQVTILGETLTIKLREKGRKVERELTAEEIREGKTLETVWNRWKYLPAGTFELQAHAYYGLTRTWRDGEDEDERLEEKMNAILLYLIKLAGRKRIVLLKNEQEARKREEEERIRQEEARRWQEEKDRQERFLREVSKWHRSQRIRSYINAIHDNLASTQRSDLFSPDQAKWFQWANQIADRIDPMPRRMKALMGIPQSDKT